MSEEERCCVAPPQFFHFEGRSRAFKVYLTMYFVYILRSIKHLERLYIGLTKDITERLKEHNAGTSNYSKTYAPWKIEAYIALTDKEVAENLERYLKSGSGFAFLKKRLLPKLKFSC